MSKERNSGADGAASTVLFVVILLVSVGLAMGTDLNIVVRGGIAVVAGIIAAVLTYVLVSRRARRSRG